MHEICRYACGLSPYQIHIFSSNGSLVIFIKTKTMEILSTAAILLFYILQKIILSLQDMLL
jgi:hypothetical protein